MNVACNKVCGWDNAHSMSPNIPWSTHDFRIIMATSSGLFRSCLHDSWGLLLRTEAGRSPPTGPLCFQVITSLNYCIQNTLHAALGNCRKAIFPQFIAVSSRKPFVIHSRILVFIIDNPFPYISDYATSV